MIKPEVLERTNLQAAWFGGYLHRIANATARPTPSAKPVEYKSADPKYPGTYVHMVEQRNIDA